jgi:hypothetical protein
MVYIPFTFFAPMEYARVVPRSPGSSADHGRDWLVGIQEESGVELSKAWGNEFKRRVPNGNAKYDFVTDFLPSSPDYSIKPLSLGAQAPKPLFALWRIRTQSRTKSGTENQGVFKHGPVCPNMSLR